MRIEEVRTKLCLRLRRRRGEIVQAILSRVEALSDLADDGDPIYAEGLRATVAAAIDYGIATLERSEDRAPPIPTPLLSQARLAARHGIGLDIVLRRYSAGHALLGDFVIEEAEQGGFLSGASLRRLLRSQAALYDRVIAAVAEEYGREVRQPVSPEQRLSERVKRLLEGELADTAELDYDLGGWHIGIIASGSGAAQLLRRLATDLDRRLLLIPGEPTFWAWLGGRARLESSWEAGLSSMQCPAEVSLAIGEPGRGLAGWRLTHRQAQAALSVALRRPRSFTRYAEVALLSAVARDEDLVSFLIDTYLQPLAAERDGGKTLRKTLRAYLAAGRNVSSAAAALGIARQTVATRLQAIETRIGRPLNACGPEIETVLRLTDIDS